MNASTEPLDCLDSHWASRVDRIRGEQTEQLRDLQTIKTLGRIQRDDLLCVMVVYNESLRLPDTLRHYRQIGVDRFALIDNMSDDGTLQFLLAQSDCDIYQMPRELRHAMGGAGWRSALVHSYYGSDRWVVCTDADEQLVYDDCERKTLKQLTAVLEREGRTSLPCLMIDMYSERGVLTALHEPQKRLLDTCSLFDREGYQFEDVPATFQSPPRLKWSGGPAERYLNAPVGWLGKVPLLRWFETTWCLNPHVVYPFASNFGRPRGGLMHFKWLSDFAAQVSVGVQRNQYAANSAKYRRFQESIAAHGDFCFANAQSARFTSSSSFVEIGLIDSIAY
jgi:hypothetical protein